MSCHAQGRCHFCSQKHLLTVYGSKKSEHELMQTANLSLIILNTVCTSCINIVDGFIKNKIKSKVNQAGLKKKEETIISTISKSNMYLKCTQGETHQNYNGSTVNKESQTDETLHEAAYVISNNVNISKTDGVKKETLLCLYCNFCNKKFNHTGDLNKHKRKHTKEKPYVCCLCQKEFSHASNLTRHKKMHSGERPFLCKKCQCSFSRKDKLSQHLSGKRCALNSSNINI